MTGTHLHRTHAACPATHSTELSLPEERGSSRREEIDRWGRLGRGVLSPRGELTSGDLSITSPRPHSPNLTRKLHGGEGGRWKLAGTRKASILQGVRYEAFLDQLSDHYDRRDIYPTVTDTYEWGLQSSSWTLAPSLSPSLPSGSVGSSFGYDR